MSGSILINAFGNMCITIMSLSFSMLVSCESSLEYVSSLGLNLILFSLFIIYIDLLYIYGLFSWRCLANIDMILLGI